MKIKTETKVAVSNVALTREEIKTLVSAQKILDKIWDELDDFDFDNLSENVVRIYNEIDVIGTSLDTIANFVDEED